MSYQQSHTLSPGPDSPTDLTLEHQHRSIAKWEGKDLGVLKIGHRYQMH